MNEEIVFGTGCFWCTEAIFKRIEGVVKTEVGYAGGNTENPTYDEVCTGTTGHAEVTKITYDPKIISFEKLMEMFIKSHDPMSLNRQGNDVGTEYRSIVLYINDEQKKIATEMLKGTVTEIKKLDKFYKAEEFHEDFFARHPESGYCQWVIAPKLKKIGL